MENQTVLKKGGIKGFFARREATVAVIVVVLAVILGFSTNGTFFSERNLQSTFMGLSGEGILAIGMTFVLITGGIDLSVGAVYGLAAMATCALTKYAGMNVWPAVILSILLGTGIGVANGFFVAKIKLTPMIATIGTMNFARGLILVISKGSTLTPSNIDPAFRFLGSGVIGFIPMFFVIFIAMVILSEVLLRKSRAVRKIFYTGSNETAARLSGIRASMVKFKTYITCALLSSISGILYLSRFNTAVSNAGQGAEMNVIAACVIGGVSMTGGEGTVVGAALGTLLMSFLSNGLVLWKVSVYYQSMISGLILLLAVTIDAVTHMKRK